MPVMDGSCACLAVDIPTLLLEEDVEFDVIGEAVCLPSTFLDGLVIVLPLFMPFMTWLRMSFLDRRSIAALSTNWKDIYSMQPRV